MGRIGIYGGSFDPPHVGHVRGAIWAKEALGLNKLLVFPAHQAPGKEPRYGSAPPQVRLELTRLSFRDYPGVEVLDFELNTPGCRTWQTAEYVRSLYPEDELVLLLGSDKVRNLPNWVRSDHLLSMVTVAVMLRGTKGEKDFLTGQLARLRALGARVILLENPALPISSTQIRRMVAFGCAGELVHPLVLEQIHRRQLYHTAARWKSLPMEELETVVVNLLNPNRIRHVLGCRDTAVELARRWGADETDAGRAGLLHDITKALDGPLQLTLCDAYGKILSDFSRKYPKTLHALTGSLVAGRVFGENQVVVSAICHHTTGRADMTCLEKIIYVADYMEPNRDFPGVERLRQLAFTDLDAALKLGLEMTLEHLHDQGAEVSPESREALAWLNR